MKSDNHIDELGAILAGFRNEIQRSERMIRLDGNAKTLPDIDMAVEVVKNATDTATQAIEDFYRNKILEAEKNVMAKFGIEKGVKYDVKKSDKVIVLTAHLNSKGEEPMCEHGYGKVSESCLYCTAQPQSTKQESRE